MAVSDRTFGVEIECTYGSGPKKTSDVLQRLHYAERDPMRQRAIKEIKATKDFKRWADNVGIDGSGIEIRSPILKGEEGLEELAAFFKFLNERESTVTNQDGMHVHHGAEDYANDWPKLYHLCASWGKWTPQIHKLVANRRRNGGMCPDAFNNKAILEQLEIVCTADKDRLAEWQRLYREYQAALNRYYYYGGRRPTNPPPPRVAQHPSQLGGRGALNLSNLRGQRGKTTIEIRLAEGMMDGDAAVAWVKFGQRFLDQVAETGNPVEAKPKTLGNLFKAINLDDDATTVLKAKADNKGNALVKPAPGKVADGINYNEEEDE